MNGVTLSEPEQRRLTRMCMRAAQLLMQHGAESSLVENVTVRLGAALGLAETQLGITANALSLTTLAGGHCITTVRRNVDRGINMHMVAEVQRLLLRAERREVAVDEVERRLADLRPLRYHPWLLGAAIGVSCACFARLMGADWPSCVTVSVASGTAMLARQALSRWHVNPMVNFAVTAFVATSVSGLALRHGGGGQPEAVLAASVLLLVPGYPLINAVADMLKGYANTGWSRWLMAMLLVLAGSVGVSLALTVWRIKLWI
jgi:uncharacterized membrane protein YjjP (DUF1212 family)